MNGSIKKGSLHKSTGKSTLSIGFGRIRCDDADTAPALRCVHFM